MGAPQQPEHRAEDRSSHRSSPHGDGVEPVGLGYDVENEQRFRASWGLLPDQWRPVGSMSLVSRQAAFVYRTDTTVASPVLLRARKAYDLIASSATPLRAEPTGRGLALSVPLGLVGRHLRLLEDNHCLPDEVMLPEPDSPAARRLVDQLRGLMETRPQPIEVTVGLVPGA